MAAKKRQNRINTGHFAVQYAEVTHFQENFRHEETQCGKATTNGFLTTDNTG